MQLNGANGACMYLALAVDRIGLDQGASMFGVGMFLCKSLPSVPGHV